MGAVCGDDESVPPARTAAPPESATGVVVYRKVRRIPAAPGSHSASGSTAALRDERPTRTAAPKAASFPLPAAGGAMPDPARLTAPKGSSSNVKNKILY